MTSNQLDLVLELTKAFITHVDIPPEVYRLLDTMAEIEGKQIQLRRQKAQRTLNARIDSTIKQMQQKRQIKPRKQTIA